MTVVIHYDPKCHCTICGLWFDFTLPVDLPRAETIVSNTVRTVVDGHEVDIRAEMPVFAEGQEPSEPWPVCPRAAEHEALVKANGEHHCDQDLE